MKLIIKLEMDDIKTRKIGLNYEVAVNDQLSVIFSPEALDMLFSDREIIDKGVVAVDGELVEDSNERGEV